MCMYVGLRHVYVCGFEACVCGLRKVYVCGYEEGVCVWV